jgi:2'-5' RNA ligase
MSRSDSDNILPFGTPKRVHESTIAIVPPSITAADAILWESILTARKKLLDKGYFRWAPHVNLIYPFIQPKRYDDVVHRLAKAIEQFPPFEVSLSEFGVFGGRTRGVLWLDSIPTGGDKDIIKKIQNALITAIEDYESDDCASQALTSARNDITDDVPKLTGEAGERF